VEEWRGRDPLASFGRRLVGEGVLGEDELAALDSAAVARVDEAVAFADASPFPPPESLYDDVYVLGDQVQGWYSVDERSAGVHRGEDERELASRED
jgi:TPP-dependent pyruvate/acetoin dehydrogenase alpha subunit